jgi:hypothetical protein
MRGACSCAPRATTAPTTSVSDGGVFVCMRVGERGDTGVWSFFLPFRLLFVRSFHSFIHSAVSVSLLHFRLVSLVVCLLTAGSLVFLRNLLNANPADWDMLLFNGLRVDGVSERTEGALLCVCVWGGGGGRM